MRKIYLSGMIGSGKTTVGERLARRLALPFYDLDREMDAILGYSFHRLVREKGWVPFRELEYDICKKFARMEKGVFGLGGGKVRYQWNVDVLRGTGPFILLLASPAELIRRVRSADRPRVNPGASLEEDILAIWRSSEQKYRSAADLVYSTENKSVEQTVRDLENVLRRNYPG